MTKKILFDEQGLKVGTPYIPGQWKHITTHTSTEIKGFFGDWDTQKLHVMEELLQQKFNKTQNLELYQKLQETGNKYLEETNYWGDSKSIYGKAANLLVRN